MAVTSDSYTGNGSQTTYSFTFPYLKEADVKVKINGTTQNTTEYSLPTATTLQFNSAPANGAAILIFRDTDNSTRAASFYPGSAIKATDLNENFDQILYTAQEVDETALSSQGDDPMQGDLSMGNNKLTNLATPTATTDGANKTYVDSTIDTKIDSALTDDVVAGSSISISDNTPSSGKITLNVIAATGSNSGSLSASDKSKLDGIETGATADQTNAEIRAAVEAATDSNVFTDADHSKLNAIEASATADQTASEIKTLLQSDKLTDSEIATGTLDNRYYTETEVDANFYKLGSAGEIASGETWTAADTKIATTAAIDARITDLVDDVGGFVPIANETSFPNANPDVNNGAGTLVSIKALGSNLTSNGSGVATIANGTVGNSTVTITGLANSTTYAATFGMIVETTSTLNTYTFHRQVPKATEVTTVAGSISNVNAVGNNTTNINTVAGANSNISTVAGAITNVNNVGGSIANVNTVATNISSVNDFAARYRVASSAPSSSLDTGDLYFDTTGNELKVYNGSAWQGGVTATGNLLSKSGDQMTGNLTFSGSQTVDGRDVSADGTKLDGIAASANNYTHPNHTGEVTSSADGAQTIANNVVDEANLKVSNSPTNGYALTAQSGNTGGLTWAAMSSGTTINNNADNRLITGSGSADTLEGESALTFDGSILNYEVDANNEGITLHAAGAHAPEVILVGTRTAEDDELGKLIFKWGYTNATDREVAKIAALAGSDTTNKDNGKLVFYTASSYQNVNAALTLNSDKSAVFGDSVSDDEGDLRSSPTYNVGTNANLSSSGKTAILTGNNFYIQNKSAGWTHTVINDQASAQPYILLTGHTLYNAIDGTSKTSSDWPAYQMEPRSIATFTCIGTNIYMHCTHLV